ncbi:hypothetical protein JHN53_30400 [Streptomyces sp. MBT58]|uniref:DUF7718 family protein n=1 Tax=Streptomyces sp. MBT58 TaxID=1488389 RepID=UPI001912D898|nr:hypothetical protein [Streptomyces sp. MBT58]MBK5995866.1 hypothetical protein [Streptomyces sp. MBT58]
MGGKPEVQIYTPPGTPPAAEQTFPIELSEENRLVVRLRTYRKKIVDYAVMQETSVAGEWVHVARIDCCGGTIHRHLVTQGGKTLLDHDLIRDIPYGEKSWEVVDDSYEGALDEMEERWEDNLRRWRRGH